MKLTLDNLPMYCEELGDCWMWKQGVNGQGYPQACIDKRPGVMVRRYVMELMGRTLQRNQPVSCRCGNKLCVNPAHLVASDHSQVLKRSYRNGRRSTPAEYLSRLKAAKANGMARMTEEQLRAIRTAPTEETITALAARLGLGRRAVSDARAGRSWRHSAPASSVFSWAGGA